MVGHQFHNNKVLRGESMMLEDYRVEIPDEVANVINDIIRNKDSCKIDESLSINEMECKIKELRLQATKLTEEACAYNEYIKKYNEQIMIEKRSNCVSKCFMVKPLSNLHTTSFKDIVAFRIIEFYPKDYYSMQYAKCITLKKSNKEIGISICELPIWKSASILVEKPRFIDLFEEIKYEEFKDLYNKWTSELTSGL